MSARERMKGAVAEREVCQILHEHGWPDARRTHDGREQARRGDIANGPAGTHLEVKRQEKLNVPRAFDQLLADCPAGVLPVLVHRPSRHEWMATLELGELLALLALRERS